MTDAASYAWVDDEESGLDSGCIGICIDIAEGPVAAAFGIDPSSRRLATIGESWDMAVSDEGNDVVQIAQLGGAFVTFEPNGWRGVDQDAAADLSHGGQYAAYYWSVNGDMTFVYAVDGAVVRTFDPLLYDATEAVAQESDLPFPREDATDEDFAQIRAASFALLERLTGIAIARDWLLEAARPTYRAR